VPEHGHPAGAPVRQLEDVGHERLRQVELRVLWERDPDLLHQTADGGAQGGEALALVRLVRAEGGGGAVAAAPL
jgi:hypothetical protein